MKHSTIRPLLAGLAITAMAFSVAAQQATPGQGPGAGGMMAPGSGPMMQGAGPQGAGPMMQGAGPQGMGPHGGMGPRAGAPGQQAGDLPQAVIDQLALTADQKPLLDAAQKARTDLRATRTASRAEHFKAMEALYAADPVDPRALMTLAKQERAKMEANMDAVQQKWLAFWDSLTIDQKKVASTYLKSRHADHAQRMPQSKPQG